MLCASPITGWRSQDGKVTTKLKDAWTDQRVTVPCGNCIQCRIDLTQQWGTRCYHEAQFFEQSMFLTLTYDDENLPFGGSLDPEEISNFIKKLRNRGHEIRYFGGAEYIPPPRWEKELGRPHYHLIIFGLWPDDAEKVSGGKKPSFGSKYIREVWGKGHIEFSYVTPQSAAYCAGYSLKKVKGEKAADHYQKIDPETGEIYDLVPEHSRQSLKPGIGERWIRKYLHDVYPNDCVIIDGQPVKPPRYYDEICKKLDPKLYAKVQAKRRELELKNWTTVQQERTNSETKETFVQQVRVKKDPNRYTGSDRQRFTKEKILRKNQRERNLTR